MKIQPITRGLLIAALSVCFSFSLQAQACDCVCSGATGLPDPLVIPPGGPATAMECSDLCTSFMYTGSAFAFGFCQCTGAPADPPDPTPPVESPDAATCATGCDALNYTMNVCTPVPVELISFEGAIQDKQVLLSWKTASEIDNAGFEVERSKDGITWQVLDFVKGSGTTVEVQDYKWSDSSPLERVNYYRLKQIDRDDTFEYSRIINITFGDVKNSTLLAWPNPAKEYINFQLTEVALYDGEVLQIYNHLGQLVKVIRPDRFNMRLNQGEIFIGDLPKGFYVLGIRQDGLLMSKSFIKQ